MFLHPARVSSAQGGPLRRCSNAHNAHTLGLSPRYLVPVSPVEIWTLQSSRRLVSAKVRAFLDVVARTFPERSFVSTANCHCRLSRALALASVSNGPLGPVTHH